MYQKITVGYVTQAFDDNGLPVRQEFIASDEVYYEDPHGEAIDSIEIQGEIYLPFEMVQPSHESLLREILERLATSPMDDDELAQKIRMTLP